MTLTLDEGQCQSEEDREDDNLKDFVVGHGLRDAAREDMTNEGLEAEVTGIDCYCRGR
ncbi:hypothetical protein D9M68_951350 [compost metagenome]